MRNVLPETPPVHEEPAGVAPQASVPRWQDMVTLIGTVFFTVALIVLVPVDFVERLGEYGYLGIFLLTLLANATIVLPSPAIAAAFLGGTALNPWIVGVLSGIAAGIGETTGYLAGYSGSKLATSSRLYPRVQRWVEQWGVMTIFVLAFIPSPVFDLAGIAAGVLRMPFRKYFIACTAGKLLRFVSIAWIGYISSHWFL